MSATSYACAKSTPAAARDWSIIRLGADIGLRCSTCSHRILLARSVFERRLKIFLSRAVTFDPTADAG